MSAMTVGARDEVTITVGEESVTLIWTNRSLAEAERAMGKALLGLKRDDLHIDDVAILIRSGLAAARRERGGGKPVSMDEAWHVMDLIGFVKAFELAGDGIAEVLGYRPEDDDAPAEAGYPPE